MNEATEIVSGGAVNPYSYQRIQNNNRENRFKKWLQDHAWLSFVFIILRKVEQMGHAIAQNILEPFREIPPAALEAIKYTQMFFYGVYTLIGTIATALKLYNIWSGNGPYAQKTKALWQKIKTTIFSGGMQLSDLSIFGFSIAVTLGAATIASPVGYILLGINAIINIVKYSWSIGRELNEAINGRFNGYRMADKFIKLGMTLLMVAGIVLVAALAATPYGAAITAGVFVVWAAARLIYKEVKKHIIKPKIEERDIELGKIPAPKGQDGASSAQKTSYRNVRRAFDGQKPAQPKYISKVDTEKKGGVLRTNGADGGCHGYRGTFHDRSSNPAVHALGSESQEVSQALLTQSMGRDEE